MIVRDESAVIERCLRSAIPHISSWSICDTGSTDGTPERVAAILEGIPGRVHHRAWRDFGTNRSEALALARGTADYLLLLDADQELVADRPLPALTHDAYQVRYAGALDYAVPRLVRGDLPWRYVGSTHEYLALDAPFTVGPLDGFAVVHHGDGGSKADKFERDRALLERDLAERPDDPRTTYYLANTLRDLGEHDLALEHYRRRVALGGWNEEVFEAAFQAGLILAARHSIEAIPQFIAAWNIRPTRAEPLHALAALHRDAGLHEAAHLFADRGLAVPYPEDILFVRRDIYTWGLRLERSIAAHWTGRFDQALADGDALVADATLPLPVRRRAARNRNLTLAALGRPPIPLAGDRLDAPARPLAELAPSARFGRIEIATDPAWPALNPSIAADGDGFRVVIRTANYRMDEQGRYLSLDGGREIRTLNYLAHLDGELGLTRLEALVDTGAGPELHPSLVLGFEDCRLVEVDGRWHATATVRDRNPEMRCEIALLELDGPRIARVGVLPGPHRGRHEKNWMPFVRDGRLHLLYWSDPVVVLACDPAAPSVIRAVEHPPIGIGSELRGGSQGVAVDGGWLFAVHEAHAAAEGRRYLHRFILLDDDLRLAGMTPLVTLLGERIEFVAGMAARGDELVLSFGAMDREAWLGVVRRDEVLALLERPDLT